MPKAYIRVTLKEGLFDAQGAAVQKSLQQLGHDFVQNVSIGKLITVEVDDTHSAEALDQRLDQMCRQLLANPVMEEYEVRLEDGEVLKSSAATSEQVAPSISSSPQVREPFSSDYTTYSVLPEEEKLDLRSQALLKHRDWINEQLDERNADWILVIGGEVIDSGETLETYPGEGRLKKLGKANDLVPWVFTRPSH